MNRELRNLASNTDGNYWNNDLRGQRRQNQRQDATARAAETAIAEAPLPAVAAGPRNAQGREDEEEWVGPVLQADQDQEDQAPQAQPSSQRKKNKNKEPITQSAGENVAWEPNMAQTICITAINRHNAKLRPEDIEPLRIEALKNRTAIMVQSECRINEEAAEKLEMKNHHSFFAGLTHAERENRYIKAKKPGLLEKIASAINIEERNVFELELSQVRELLKSKPNKGWKHGLALYINRAVFPEAVLKDKGQDHILVEVTDLKGQKQLILALYGPPEGSSLNNEFYNNTIRNIHTKYGTLPILQIGDHNAQANLRKDCDVRESPSKKTGLATIISELLLTDIRVSHGTDKHFTFTKSAKGIIKYRANLDFFIGNEKWIQLNNNKVVEIRTKSVEDRDHRDITLEMRQYSKKVSAIKEPAAKRKLDEKEKKELKEFFADARLDTMSPENALQLVMDRLTGLQQSPEETEEKDKKRIPRNESEAQQVNLKIRIRKIHKIIQWSLALPADMNITSLFQAKQNLDKNDRTPNTQIRRALRTLENKGLPLEQGHQQRRQGWTEELIKLKRKLKNEQRALSRKMEREKIRYHVKRLVESFSGQPRYFFRRMRAAFNKQAAGLSEVRFTEGDNTRVTSDPQECCEAAATFYAKLYETRGEKREDYKKWLTPKQGSTASLEKLERPITEEDVADAIKKLKNNKATGEDHITAELLKELNDIPEIKITLSRAFQAFATGQAKIPANWRKGVMILLFKSGDKLAVENYRPITLMDVPYKIYTSLLYARLIEFIEDNKFLNINQNGFRPDRSTTQKLWVTNAFLLDAKNKGKEAHLISLDLKKAYDSIEHWLIEEAMGPKGINIPTALKEAIMDTLSNSTVQVRIAGRLSKEVKINRGVKQGDPLSPLLFNLAIDPLLHRLEQIKTDTNPMTGGHAFADDIDMLYNDKENTTKGWNAVQDFMRDSNLELNGNKTTYATNAQAKQNNNVAKLKMHDDSVIRILSPTQPLKILGVEFTMELDWSHQKRVTKGKLLGCLGTLMKRAITNVQIVEVINIMLLAAASYAMTIVPYNDEELTDIQNLIQNALLKRLRIQEKKGWTDWLVLHRDNGGMGLNLVKDLYQAQQINGLTLTLNGPDCAARRILVSQMTEGMDEKREVTADNPLSTVIQVLQSQNATLNSRHEHTEGKLGLHNRIKDLREVQAAKRKFHRDKRNDIGFWIDTLFNKTVRWEARDALEMRTRLNTFAQDWDYDLTQTQFESFAQALREEYKTHVTDDVWETTIGNLRAAHNEIFTVAKETADHIWRKRVETWRPKPKDEITNTLLSDNDGLRLFDAENQQERTAIDNLFNAITEATQPNNLDARDKSTQMYDIPRQPNDRIAKTEFAGQEWEVTYTDGSQTNIDDTQRAGWATFRPFNVRAYRDTNAGQDGTYRQSARVDGPQINSRAELSAILAALLSARGRKNQLIVTDSKSSIDLLDTWREGKLSNRQKRKTPNRDLVKSIIEAEKQIAGTVRYYHIYSHQQNTDEERRVKINNQRNKLSPADQPLYKSFTEGNEEADRLAGSKTTPGSGTGRTRDWNETPIHNVDDFYIVREGTLEDRPPHKWIKDTTQKEILRRKQAEWGNPNKQPKGKARSKYLKYLKYSDKKRSFAAGDRANHTGHRTYTALFKLRCHAAPTAKKTRTKASYQDMTSPYKQFYAHLYPDDKCYACSQKGIDIVEDTKHLVECANRDDRKIASQKLWTTIYEKIKSKQKQGSAKEAAWLKPFALRTQEALGLHHVGAGHRLSAALAEVATFPDEAAQLGLIPRTLEGALRELDVEDPKLLADEIARLCQDTVAADLYARHEAIAAGRDQKALFATHVLGKQNV